MAESAAAGKVHILRDDVVATVLDHGALLLDLDSKYFYQLNPAGWAITQLFESATSADHAVARAKAWGATAADEPAVRAFVDALRGFGLLQAAAVDELPHGEAPPEWQVPVIERQPEPLQRVITSAFDPTIPLAE